MKRLYQKKWGDGLFTWGAQGTGWSSGGYRGAGDAANGTIINKDMMEKYKKYYNN
jgi:hypothetical protein